MHANPLLQASTLPYQLPPFDQVDDQHYREAFTQGMAAQLREVAAITGQDAAPGFDNTIVALERSGQQLDRAMAVFFNLIASNTNDVMQQLESELAPLLAAHEDAIALDSKRGTRTDISCRTAAVRMRFTWRSVRAARRKMRLPTRISI